MTRAEPVVFGRETFHRTRRRGKTRFFFGRSSPFLVRRIGGMLLPRLVTMAGGGFKFKLKRDSKERFLSLEPEGIFLVNRLQRDPKSRVCALNSPQCM